ncbi:tRNA (adenosine(37)-N6)-threonylcarbamoyltransferase complex ATPase subunit type 1 TsaE [Halalkalibaculum sp. DA3122]|uniref:tRNA (adenosine(37)-N6)-threonylcarbamoyltransferase complex ATPase subunit type 1 TsaE n=1 Tax=unclassified Halalkalibaculum TaxID=2964617 RepID=UPI0037547D76
METEVVTTSEEETRELAGRYAKQLAAGDVVCLQGPLGAGKTQFVKGMAGFFGVDPREVLSPTYTLIHEYDGTLPIFHFDCYRMENPEEALEIGAEEYFYREGVSVIEWPEKIRPLIPAHSRWINIEPLGPRERKFIFGNEKK